MSVFKTKKFTLRFETIPSTTDSTCQIIRAEKWNENHWMQQSLAPQRVNGSPTMNRLRGLTYSQLLYGLNLVAMIAHISLAITVLSIAKGPVNVELWSTRSRIQRPDLDDLIRGNASFEFDFIPYFELDANPPIISVLWFTATFFILSAGAHAFVVTTGITGTVYYRWIHNCRQPLRWVEYFFSSSFMIVAISIFCGLRSAALILSIATLNAITMSFGWVTEEFSRPESTERTMTGEERHKKWCIGADSVGVYLFTSALQRLGPFFLGCVPYAVAWATLIVHYFESTQESRKDGVLPGFVDVLVFSQFGLFTLFGVVMLVQQSTHWGCEQFYWGEVAYIILSLTAKATLGGILITQVFIASRFDDIFDVDRYIARMNATNNDRL